MTSKFSIDNKELLQRISSGEAVVGIDFGNLIVRELAAFRMAVMDSSESVELPLDYLQGHKDGLEWAAQLAEANHPETGEWLYDDPIELAKAIRKGPDMPPVQPVADSEPAIIVGDDGGDALAYRRLIQSFAPGTKLYRHAQPAPEYPETLPCPVLLEPGLRFGKGIKTSTMLAALSRRAVYETDLAALSPEERAEFQARIEDFKALIAQPAPVVPEEAYSDDCPELYPSQPDAWAAGWNSCRAAMLRAGNHTEQLLDMADHSGDATKKAGNSPVIPDGYVMVPKEPTKGILDEFDSIIDYGAEDSVDAWSRLLAAAPQEVNDAHH